MGVLAAFLVSSVRALSFVALLLQRRLRADLGAWLVAGVTASAFVPIFVIAHTGYSQYYFLYGVIPVGSALLMYAVAEFVGSDRRRMTLNLGGRGRERRRPASSSGP